MTAQDNAYRATGTGNPHVDFFAIPGDNTQPAPIWGFLTRDNRFGIGGSFDGFVYGAEGHGGHPDDGKTGPDINDYSGHAGVIGTGVDVTGVAGTSVNWCGVYGQTGEILQSERSFPQHITTGVFGAGRHGPGVVGWSIEGRGVEGYGYQSGGVLGDSSNGIGVQGSSSNGYGVYGTSQQRAGVRGHSIDDVGVIGTCGDVLGLPGPTIPHPVTIAGVIGTSNTVHGVIGSSRDNAGVYGYSSKSHGIFGATSNPAAFAGIFQGNVFSNGTISAPVKNGVVPFPDGSQRLLHCMESPEHWFEDFGSAKLARGRAVVKLDADFAKVIKRGDYRVFVTPEGDCRGLYVRRKRTNSFEVRELTGGKSSVEFSYRIVGRRKDIKQHRRFAKFDPRLPLPTGAARAPRKPGPTAAGLRAFVARVEKEARERAPMGAEKGRARMRTKRPRPDFARLRQQLSPARAEKK
jgi:hypothetical protein